MEEDLEASHSTVAGWFHPDPSTMDTVSLVRLARKKNLNLNWLLLGEGPELRGISEGDVWERLRETLVAELVSHGESRAVAERVLPHTDPLFHLNIVFALEQWMEHAKGARGGARFSGQKKRRTIADAIQETLDQTQESP